MRFRNEATAILLMTLSSCAPVGPDYAPDETPAPGQFEMSGDTPAPGLRLGGTVDSEAWWHFLNAPKLDSIIDLAFAGSPTLAEANAAIAAAQASADAAHGGSRPQLDANAGLERERVNSAAFGFTGFPPQTISRYSVGASVSYDLDLFGGHSREIESADAGTETQRHHFAAARLTLAGNIVLSVVELAALQSEIATMKATLEGDRKQVTLVEHAITAGATARASLIKVNAQLAKDEAELPARQQRYAVLRHALALLVGRAPANWAPPDFALADFSPPGELPVAIPSVVLKGRPDIRAAEAALHAATARIGVQTAKLYPDISITANLAQIALTPENIFSHTATGWGLGSQLFAPIFNGGTLSANVRRAEAERDAAGARYRTTVVKVFVEVADALQGIANSDAEYRALQSLLDLEQENLRLAQRSLELGGANMFQVLDAQRRSNEALRSLANAQGRRLASLVRLKAATATAP